MSKYGEPNWLEWAKRLQGLAQSGLTYTKDKYELDRYQQLRDLSVEIMDHYTEAGEEKVRELFCFDRGYQTPKLDIRGAVFNEKDEILLVHEEIDGKWAMPGGWADIYYSVRENVEKECREEAGIAVKTTRLVGIFDWAKDTEALLPWCLYKIVMLAEPIELSHWSFVENMETSEAKFFSLDSLPELSQVRTTKELIQLSYKRYKNPNLPPIID